MRPNAEVEWLVFLFRTQEVASSDLDGLSESSLSWFFTVPPHKNRIRTLHRAHVISNYKSLRHKTLKRKADTYFMMDLNV